MKLTVATELSGAGLNGAALFIVNRQKVNLAPSVAAEKPG
jgi:hypothetical protein